MEFSTIWISYTDKKLRTIKFHHFILCFLSFFPTILSQSRPQTKISLHLDFFQLRMNFTCCWKKFIKTHWSKCLHLSPYLHQSTDHTKSLVQWPLLNDFAPISLLYYYSRKRICLPTINSPHPLFVNDRKWTLTIK